MTRATRSFAEDATALLAPAARRERSAQREALVAGLAEARILVVDDEAANTLLLQRLLARVGHRHVTVTNDSREVLDLVAAEHPDVVLLDLHMPHLDGWQVLEQLRSPQAPDDMVPVVVLTADVTVKARDRALSLGANDVLTKPFDASEVHLRVRNLLENRLLLHALEQHNALLDRRVRQRTAALELAQQEMLSRLAAAAGYRDEETHRHAERVGELASLLALEVGLSMEEAGLIGRAAVLHDIGKIGIPDAVLRKPGPLEPGERAVVETHAAIGADMLSGGSSDLLQLAEIIARCHHERWDGRGYPAGLAGETIPLAARIVAIVDVYDALLRARPYKPAWSASEAIAELRRNAGRQFDPRLVGPFLAVLRRLGEE